MSAHLSLSLRLKINLRKRYQGKKVHKKIIKVKKTRASTLANNDFFLPNFSHDIF